MFPASETVSVEVEIPQDLYEQLQEYVKKTPLCDQDSVVRGAIGLFLMITKEQHDSLSS